MNRIQISLSAKVTILLILCMVTIFGVIGFLNTRMARRHLTKAVYQNADHINDIIKRGTNYSMLKNERESVYRIIQSIAQEPGILKIRIYNKEGTISFSTEATEVDTTVNIQAEACIICHGGSMPLGDVPIQERARDYINSDGNHVLGVISPIKSESSCVTASCHAHRAGQNILGVLDVIMQLDRVDVSLHEYETRFVWYVFLAILVICVISIIFVYFMVHRPINKITQGTERVADGDLDFEINVRSRDEIGGLARSFNHMTQDLKSARKEITRWTLTLEDLVEERTAQLKRAQENIIQSEKMASVGRLAAIVAHEINNPLAGIRTYAKLLIKKLRKMSSATDFEDHINYLEIIENESARCGEIVKNLLQFSRPSALHVERQDLNRLVQESLSLVQHKIELLHIEVRLSLADELIEIYCDGQRIKQALIAVLINACDAMEKDRGTIEIRSRFLHKKKGAEVSIQDNGFGMDEETRAHMFEPFFSTKDDGKGKGTNIGLGSSIVYEIIKSHNGEISVDSALNMGTTTTIFLPVKPDLVIGNEK
jgi:two-component system NtrC family sensor kinase